MTYKELKDEIRGQLWAEGEQENLITIHDAFFQQAVFDLVKVIPCLQQAQKDVFPHCATYFNCGMTVLPKPQGRITRVFVIDKLNPVTGLEDVEADDEWCSKVMGQNIDFCHISRYVKLCERCSSSAPATDALATLLFGAYRNKRRYPRPTDEGLEALPKLPEGYHYPQTSTDAEGRSSSFVYAFRGGNIFIAPWIQSTETVVIEWNGIKRRWNDADLVDDDPKFKQAVRLHVGHQHESAYGDPAKAQDFYGQLWGHYPGDVRGAIPMLIHECAEESRVQRCDDAGGGANVARGMGQSSGAVANYSNERQEVTATCPAGKSGASVKVVKEAGTVQSALSVADANALAIQQASTEANAQLVCTDPVVTYYSVEVSRTASCPGASNGTPAATGDPVTATIEAGRYTSTVSQAAADSAAAAAAQALADSQLVCTFHNAEQTATASCPADTTGDDVDVTIAAGTSDYDSTISQADADAKAKAAAQNQANTGLTCVGDSFLVGNTQQLGRKSAYCPGLRRILTAQVIVAANTFTQRASTASQAQIRLVVNQQAQSLAQMRADSAWQAQCPNIVIGPEA